MLVHKISILLIFAIAANLDNLGASAIVAVGIWVFFEAEFSRVWSAFRTGFDRYYRTRIDRKIPLHRRP